jgi:photosystem II stability/assembly factor-like uncharacterized protein
MDRTVRYPLAVLCGAALTLCLLLLGAGPASALSNASGAWQWQNPLPQGNGYSGAYFLDASRGWLISGGTIYRTTDGGVTLSAQVRANVSFTAITFVGPEHGWAVGSPAFANGTAILYRTTSGGRTWTRVRLPWRGGINHVSFATTGTGWATMDHLVLHTSDGGLHWAVQRRLTGSDRALGVQALSPLRVWVATRDALLRSTTGGAAWTPAHVADVVHPSVVHFVGTSDGWAGSGAYGGTTGKLIHTTDGGRHWQVQLSGPSVSALSFADLENGWAIVGGAVYHTTDGGADWAPQASAPQTTWVTALTAQSAVVGAPATYWRIGGLSHTSDGGVTWQSDVSAADDYFGTLAGLQFVDASHGWAVGSSGGILATTDSGATWTAQSSGTTQDLTGVHFAGPANGWAVGLQGAIVHTSDGGVSWTAQTSGTSDDLTGVAFVDAENGWATGQSFTSDGYSSGLILHTTDGGAGWTTQYDSPFEDSPRTTPGVAFSAVAFADSQDGWAVGETQGSDSTFNQTVIMHTSDGGATWTQQLSYYPPYESNEDDATLTSVACTDTEHAVAVGYDEDNVEIWRTTDGGQTWTMVGKKLFPLFAPPALSDVVFANASHGWAVGGGYILRTTDGGSAWTKQLVPSALDALPLDALSFVNPTRGWAAGSGGDILMTMSGGNRP